MRGVLGSLGLRSPSFEGCQTKKNSRPFEGLGVLGLLGFLGFIGFWGLGFF